MDTPKPNSVSPPLFPIGVDITFSWHYDQYLLQKPVNLTIEAYTANNAIWTIGQGLPGSLTNYTWTAQEQNNITNPLQMSLYTLRIFDGAVGRFGRPPNGGYLATYVGLRFGLYHPEAYTPGNQMNRKFQVFSQGTEPKCKCRRKCSFLTFYLVVFLSSPRIAPVCATCSFSAITNAATKSMFAALPVVLAVLSSTLAMLCFL
jgi:hypothetical protein